MAHKAGTYRCPVKADQVFAALRNEPRPIELILVGDASTDGTWKQILEAQRADPRVHAIRHVRNFEQSAALWTVAL
jgi:glycosyltransferase involved in cell wall biosynthesis